MLSILLTLLALALPPCQTEDAQTCTWSASTQGNGIGQSYINLMGITIYLD